MNIYIYMYVYIPILYILLASVIREKIISNFENT